MLRTVGGGAREVAADASLPVLLRTVGIMAAPLRGVGIQRRPGRLRDPNVRPSVAGRRYCWTRRSGRRPKPRRTWMALLRGLTGDQQGREYALERTRTVIGRHPQCHIVLSESTVSRQHAQIVRRGEAFFVEDLGSQNGTRVNGAMIEQAVRLSTGDEIDIEGIVFRFEGDEISVDTEERPSTILTTINAVQEPVNRADVNAAQKLRALLQILESLGDTLHIEKLLPRILDGIFRIFPQADRGCILLADEQTGRLRPMAVKNTRVPSAAQQPYVISRTVARKVMDEGQAILSVDAKEDSRFVASDSVAELEIRSMMCAPLTAPNGSTIGLIELDTHHVGKQFSENDLDVLANVARLAGQAIEHARLHRRLLRLDRREQELKTAREVQLHLLPRQRPQVSGYEFCDFYRAADEVGGDYFGYLRLADGRIAITTADVAGKGVSAALLVARLCADVRYSLVTESSPAKAVQRLNVELSQSVLAGRFVTFALCVLNPANHTLQLVNAGHPAPLLWTAGRNEVQAIGNDETSGPPLGVEPTWKYKQVELSIQPGQGVLLFTDGISEARNQQGELFGETRIRDAVSGARSAQQACERVLESVESFAAGNAPRDDVCLVAFARTAR
ncbi:MAG: FHA domain-containing protein [Planctomycetota bacterium]|nr:MAG: FHA domain-containing protein [Planctomycetota bacterium]